MIKKILNHFGYYKTEDLVVGGHCGICGKWMPDKVFFKDWTWGMCNSCGSSPTNPYDD